MPPLRAAGRMSMTSEFSGTPEHRTEHDVLLDRNLLHELKRVVNHTTPAMLAIGLKICKK